MAKTVTVRQTDAGFDVVVDDKDHDGVVVGTYPTKNQAERTAVSGFGEDHDLVLDLVETDVEEPIVTDEMRPATPEEGGPDVEVVTVSGEEIVAGETPAAKAKRSKAELAAVLDAAGIAYTSKTSKAELEELVAIAEA